MKKVGIILICIALSVVIAGGVIIGVYTTKPEPKRAIIVVHAIMGGSLYNADTGEVLWEPFVYEGLDAMDVLGRDTFGAISELVFNDETVMQHVDKILENSPDSVFNQMAVDKDGNSVNNVKACSFDDFEGSERFGPFNAYEGMYKSLKKSWGEKCDVKLFNYDWRMDCRKSSEQLEKYINDNGYDEIILLSHSMGGLVSSGYLARSQENRDKIKLYCSYATPFYGAMMALSLLESGETLGDDIVGMLAGTVFESLADKAKDAYNQQFKPLLYNMASVYQLLPTIEMLNDNQFDAAYGEDSFLTVGGKPITTREELTEFYYSRPWAKDEYGNLRKQVTSLNDFADSFYVDVNGERVHSTKLVNTLYFCGVGFQAEETMRFNKQGQYINSVNSFTSDGTVQTYSSTLGKATSDLDVVALNSSHTEMALAYDEYVGKRTDVEIAKIWG